MNRPFNIRLADPNDAEQILEIYRFFITDTVVTFEEDVPAVSAFRQRIESILEESPYLVCEHNGEIVGYCYATSYRSRSAYRWNRELTVYIKVGWQAKGIGLALYSALIGILRKQNFGNLLAVITLPNESSIRLHEKMGFKPCAVFNKVGYKMGSWHQVGWWELQLIQDGEPPQEPIFFRDFADWDFVDKVLSEAVKSLKE